MSERSTARTFEQFVIQFSHITTYVLLMLAKWKPSQHAAISRALAVGDSAVTAAPAGGGGGSGSGGRAGRRSSLAYFSTMSSISDDAV